MKSEYSTKLLKRKIFVRTKWICKTKVNIQITEGWEFYVYMIKMGGDKCAINKMIEL